MIPLLASSALCQVVSKKSYLDADWLKRGCLMIVAVSQKNDGHFTEQSWRDFKGVVAWLNGFVVGANLMIVHDGQSPLEEPPPEWLDAGRIAPSILDHIEKNWGKIKSDTPARVVMSSWYLTHHPRASGLDLQVGKGMLERVTPP
ncbi:MAG: hypothetical protein JNM65_11250 [Verrucomicrobiaceae bacterium]|nr:hypothetical protein [Verrucomicrobiaceae bacterium]